MTIITIPDGLLVAKQSWGQARNSIVSASAFGGSQAIESSHPIWTMSLSPPVDRDDRAGMFQALSLSLRGFGNLLACHNLRRPVPLGTMRGDMTLSVDAAAGATSLTIVASDQAGKTLKQGDYLGLGGYASQQVVMVLSDATADESGVITVSVEAPLRTAFAAGAVVTWNKPKVLWRRTESSTNWDYEDVRVSGMAMSFVEDWRA